MARVSIIIPAYNASAYLPSAIESALAQSYSDTEIIVIDDGSTDETATIAQSYKGIIYLHQANGGVARARNHGIAQATGEYVQFLDADDGLFPHKIERCLAEWQGDIVYCDWENRSPDLSKTLPPHDNRPRPTGDVAVQFIRETAAFFVPHAPLVRRADVLSVGGFDERLKGTEDWHLWVKLALKGLLFHHIPATLCWYRYTPDSLSKNRAGMLENRLKAYQALRELDLPPEIDLDYLIAGRHHAYAMYLWAQNERRLARQQFRLARKTHPQSRIARRLLALMSYLFPAKWVS